MFSEHLQGMGVVVHMQVYHFSENASCGYTSSAIACRFFCRFLYLLFLSPQNRTYFFRMETLRLTCSSAHLEAGSQQSERVRSQHISAGSCRIFACRGMRVMRQIKSFFCAENLSLLENLTYFIWRFVIVPIISYSEIPDVGCNMTEDT